MGNKKIDEAKKIKDISVAMPMRIAGASYEMIGQKLGFSRQYAHKLISGHLQQLAAENRDSFTELQELELGRLDRLLLGVWNAAISGDPQSIDRTLKIMERRSKLLGLDAPERKEISGVDGGPIEFEHYTDEQLIAMISDGDEESAH